MVNRKEKRKYKKLLRQYRKKFRKANKEVTKTPYDYGPLLDYFILGLNFFKDYYEQDNNVHCEDSDRLKTLKETLKKYYLYKNCENEYIDSNDTKIIKQSDGSYEVVGTKYLLDDPQKTYVALDKEEKERWQAFWVLIEENYLSWWD